LGWFSLETGTYLSEADLQKANLPRTNLQGADLAGASLRRADLGEVDLRGANFRRADLREATLEGADLQGADLFEANLRSTYLTRSRGVTRAQHLETVRLTIPEADEPAFDVHDDAKYFDSCVRPWRDRCLDWENLRVVGRLPLFGLSYTALILIPIIFYTLALYNDKIELVQAGAEEMRLEAERVRIWVDQIAVLPDHPISSQIANFVQGSMQLVERLATLVKHYLRPHPIPSQSFLLLVSTVLLAAASTLFTFFCPSRIKEFSHDQWCDQLGRPLLYYWPFAWKRRHIRLICAACYALGGAGALWVLGTKIWSTAQFILKHSMFPWPWR
jgi:hypothetical protein